VYKNWTMKAVEIVLRSEERWGRRTEGGELIKILL
jgi:hypothetical protein